MHIHICVCECMRACCKLPQANQKPATTRTYADLYEFFIEWNGEISTHCCCCCSCCLWFINANPPAEPASQPASTASRCATQHLCVCMFVCMSLRLGNVSSAYAPVAASAESFLGFAWAKRCKLTTTIVINAFEYKRVVTTNNALII